MPILPPTDFEIVSTRLFRAPRELIFRAWTDPLHLARWWGPRGFGNTCEVFEPKAGGTWRFVMHGPDGSHSLNESVFSEVSEPERLVFKHLSEPPCEVSVTFREQPEGTRVDFRMRFDSVEVCAQVKTYAVPANEEHFDRLEEELARMESGGRRFELTRCFKAPRALVWVAWTEPEALMKWLAPEGLSMPVSHKQLRPGGLFHYCMQTPEGHQMWGKWIYREVSAPERLVFTGAFADAQANPQRHPLIASWPLRTLSTVLLREADGKTILTLQGVPYFATAEERETFEAGYSSMEEGWSGTFDRLERYLAQALSENSGANAQR